MLCRQQQQRLPLLLRRVFLVSHWPSLMDLEVVNTES